MIRIKAIEQLAKLIECNEQKLKGNTCAGPSGRDHRLQFPSLAITAGRFKYFPNQADCYDYVRNAEIDGGPLKEVYQVGRWEGTVTLRLGSKTPSQRYTLECALEELFLSGATYLDKAYPLSNPDECLRPGIVLVDVPDCYNARVAFELTGDSWEDEFAFTNEWYSTLRLNAVMPALVAKKKGNRIEDLNLKLTEDVSSVVETPADVPSDAETVTIDENGTITP